MFWISVALVNSVGEESLEANQEAAVRRASAAMASREAEITGCSAMGPMDLDLIFGNGID
jgi:hypothetical protein